MTIEEKIAHLQAASMEEARREGNHIIKQHKDALEKLFEEHRMEAVSQSQNRIQAESISAKQQLNMASSKAQLELKRELSKTQNQLKKELFTEVDELLADYMLTEDYRHLLVSYIEKAAKFANGEELIIYITPSDEDKKVWLEEHTGFALTVAKENFTGGIRAVIRSRNILIDYSFKSALETEYKDFLFEGGAGIE